MVRTFVAIDLPEEIRERIRESRTILAGAGGRLAIVDPANLHITVKFLGEVEPGRISAIIEALRATSSEAFEVTVGRAALNRPRSHVWSGATSPTPGRVLPSPGRWTTSSNRLIPRERRPFRPHVTLARVKEFHPSLIQQVQRMPSEPFGRFRVETIKLKKSTLTPHGPIYEDLAEVAL